MNTDLAEVVTEPCFHEVARRHVHRLRRLPQSGFDDARVSNLFGRREPHPLAWILRLFPRQQRWLGGDGSPAGDGFCGPISLKLQWIAARPDGELELRPAPGAIALRAFAAAGVGTARAFALQDSVASGRAAMAARAWHCAVADRRP